MSREFRIKDLLNELGENDPDLRDVVGELYPRTIDLGGHPNPRGVLSMAEWAEEEHGVKYVGVYLTNSAILIGASLKVAAQVAIAALRLLEHVHRERFGIMGLSDKIRSVARGL